MTVELYLWLVPLGALVVAGVGTLLIHLSTRRLERKHRGRSPAG